jgi:ethanolamine transporter EutH
MQLWILLLNVFTVIAKVVVVFLLLLLARGIVWFLNMLIFMPPFDPLNNIPGPEGSAFQNHFREVME